MHRLVAKMSVLALFLTQGMAYAESCKYKVASSKLTWTGYKFTEKFGVSGTFKEIDVKYNDAKKMSESDFFQSVTFAVKISSLDSGMPDRDKKLMGFLFGEIKDPEFIKGKVLSFDAKTMKAEAELSLNGQTRKVPFVVVKEGAGYKFTGSIDLSDFGMDPFVKKLNDACGALHAGKDQKSKTWSEVKLDVSASLDKTCG